MINNISHFFAILTLFIFPFFSSMAKEKESYVYDEVVSLGGSCQVASQIQIHHLRKHSYPLDWVITPFESLEKFIICKGDNFLDLDKISILNINEFHLPEQILNVYDLIYGIYCVHDLQADMQNYEEVKLKYDRRIKRLFELFESKKKVLFIRLGIERQQAEALNELIHNLYPKLKYTLLVVSNDEEFKKNWKIKQIKSFYIHQLPGNDQEWHSILEQFSTRE